MGKLSYFILAMLAHQPSTGYDMSQASKRISRSLPQVDVSQIYHELNDLEAEGLVTFEVFEQQGKPDKKIYTITGAGQQKLREWLYQPVKVTAVRDELIIKAYTIWLTDSPQQAASLFREHARLHQAQLDRYLEQEQTLLASGEPITQKNSPHFSHYATLKYSIGYERNYVEWCEWMVTQLESGDG